MLYENKIITNKIIFKGNWQANEEYFFLHEIARVRLIKNNYDKAPAHKMCVLLWTFGVIREWPAKYITKRYAEFNTFVSRAVRHSALTQQTSNRLHVGHR
jgi:hypothetical protein